MPVFKWSGNTQYSQIGIIPEREGFKLQLQSVQVSVDVSGYWFDPAASFTPTVSVTIQYVDPAIYGVVGLGQYGFLERTVIIPSCMIYDTVSARATIAMPYMTKNNFKDIEMVGNCYIMLDHTFKAGWTSTVGVVLEYQIKQATLSEQVHLRL